MYHIIVIFWWVTIITPFIGSLVMKWLKFSNATYVPGQFDNLTGMRSFLSFTSRFCTVDKQT